MNSKDIRNIGIIAQSIDEKITLIEKMGFYMDAEETNNSPWEWMQCEREIGIVIETFVTTESWKNIEINMVNVPSIKELDSLSIIMQSLEGLVTHISAVGGLSPLIIEFWQRQIKKSLSSLIFVGKIAQKGADFFGLVQNMQERLPIKPLVIQLPIYQADSFEGIIDLVTMRELIWEKFSEDSFEYRANNPKIQKIRPELIQQTLEYRQKMLEQIAEVDGNENLMAKFLEDEEITTEEITQAIRVATISMAVAPVVIGCLSLNIGVRELLDAIVNYLPSPLDAPFKKAKELKSGREVTIKPREDGAFVGLVVAITSDPFVGKLTIVRVYRGKVISQKGIIYNSRKESIGRIVKHKPISREEVRDLFTGEIGYITDLKEVQIGDTLCDPMHRVTLELKQNPNMNFMVRFLIKGNEEHIKSVLNNLIQYNPSCKIIYGKSLNDAILLYGKSVVQLNYLIEKLQIDFRLDIIADKPKVAYFYTLKEAIEKEYIYEQYSKHKKREKFAHIVIKLKPQKRGDGYKFVDKIKKKTLPKEFIDSINQGIKEALHEGIGNGFPIVDIEAILNGGSYDNIASNTEVFRLAGYQATKELLQKSKLIKLEPIMKLNIKADEKFREIILADITKRRGIACGRGGDEHNLGDMYVPLAEIVDYNNELYELTNGQASFEMKFERYEVVPEYLGTKKNISYQQ